MKEENLKLLKGDLLENGMVSEVLPEYINTNGLSNIKFRGVSKKIGASAMTVNLLKNDGGNRVICLPNPILYQQCIETIFNKKEMFLDVINKIEKNEYSHSKILAEDNLFNIPIKNNKSKYMESLREKMYLSIGKKYKLKYDIEKFYDSIYTHYLPAGFIGFSESLNMYRGNKEKSKIYNYMCEIDSSMRNMNNKETKGIITGPFVSRIFSELLQTEIDNEIVERIKTNKYRRYVDDGEIFLNTVDEAERDIEILKNIFQKYKLSLKMEKTEIRRIPYIDFSSLKEILNIRKVKNKQKNGWYFASQDDFFETISKAEKMQKNGKKGTLKYIFKVLNGQKNEYGINKNYTDKNNSFFYLLNYIIIYPQYAKEILKIVDRQIQYVPESCKILNDFLKQSIIGNQELVSLYIIQTLVRNCLEIDENTVIEYIKKNDNNTNEILKASFLNYLCEKNLSKKYNDNIIEYRESLRGEKGFCFCLENWLSLYILFFHDYISEDEFIDEKNVINNLRSYKRNNIKFINFNLIM